MKNKLNYLLFLIYILFLTVSWFIKYEPGILIGGNFGSFSLSMLKILPAAFILIGLFEVWIKQETIEKHLGCNAGIKSYLWVFLLAGTTIGGLYVALPVSASLYKKGARTSVLFAYLSASAVFRIPMSIFEASFLGLKFTLLRFLISLPLIILSAELIGRYIHKSKKIEDLYKNI